MAKYYPLIVIGGGHAGIEAVLVNTRKKINTLLITLTKSSIGRMSCNPSIGGSGKGNLVRELDALGGEMAKAIDQTGTSFAMLNTSKGEAVQSPRALADKYAYQQYMQQVLDFEGYLDIFEGELAKILVKNSKIFGIETTCGNIFHTKALILATGTFLKSIMHIGKEQIKGGRNSEKSAEYLSNVLIHDLNLKLGRLKTGTSPRVTKESIDFSKLIRQDFYPEEVKFSYQNLNKTKNLIHSYTTYINEKSYEIIKKNLHQSSMYSGKIKVTGVRYCPSIEDKIFRFPDKLKQQIFIEPMSLMSNEIYLNGLSTSLPKLVQFELLKSISGFENIKVLNWGYAVEYDFVFPYQLLSTLQARNVDNLFLAGQINGTSGYEEAAVQGFIAGINAYQYLKNEDFFILDRSEAYIGVLIDDLTTKNITEPYRIFSSQCEYRLSLRYDNTAERLMKYGYQFQLIHPDIYLRCQESIKKTNKAQLFIENYRLKKPDLLKDPLYKSKGAGYSLLKLIKHNLNFIKNAIQDFSELKNLDLSDEMLKNLLVKIKYEGYIKKQKKVILNFKKNENLKIPENYNYNQIKGLLKEAREKLEKFRPLSLGKASRIAGVDPSAIELILFHLKKLKKKPLKSL